MSFLRSGNAIWAALANLLKLCEFCLHLTFVLLSGDARNHSQAAAGLGPTIEPAIWLIKNRDDITCRADGLADTRLKSQSAIIA
jgi:hypothetical protein